MQYACRTIEGGFVVIATDADGNLVATSPVQPSKFAAMMTRDRAAKGDGVPAGWTYPEPDPIPAAEPKPARKRAPKKAKAPRVKAGKKK